MPKWLYRDAAIKAAKKGSGGPYPGIVEFDVPSSPHKWVWGNRAITLDWAMEYICARLENERVVYVKNEQEFQEAAEKFVDSLASILDISCGASEVNVAVFMGKTCKEVWWDHRIWDQGNVWKAKWIDGSQTQFKGKEPIYYKKIIMGLITDNALVELIRDSCNCTIQEYAIAEAHSRGVTPTSEVLSVLEDWAESRFGKTSHPASWSLVWHEYYNL